MLDAGNNFPGQLSVTKILQFDRYTHLGNFTEEIVALVAVQTGQRHAGSTRYASFQKHIHNFCEQRRGHEGNTTASTPGRSYE